MRSLITLLLVLAISASGARAATPAPASGVEAETVLLVGDSLSSAHRIPPAAGWVALLQQRLNAATPDAPLIVNASRGGKTLDDALKEMPALLAQHHPAKVILELGANDAILGASQRDLHDRLTRLIDMAQAAGATVAVLGFEVPPKLDGNHCSAMLRGVYAEVARDEHVVLLPSLMAGISDHPALLLDDGVHPSAAAQARMLDNAWDTLSPLLLD